MTKTTHATKKSELKTNWHHFDASKMVLGDLATEISTILMGKDKIDYVPYLNCGDAVVVTNASKVILTGNKEEGKVYKRHSSYVGNLKERNVAQQRAHNPNKIIQLAVKGMLPKNRLRKERLANLHIYSDSEHPHGGQIKAK